MARPYPRNWRNTELLYPAVWLLYLVFPLGTSLTADTSIVTRAMTSVLVIAFGAVYLSVYFYSHVFDNDNNEFTLWGVTGILIVLAAGTYPVTGIFFVCFIPYFCALWAFIRPGHRGLVIGICLSTVQVIGLLVVSPELRKETVPIVLTVGLGIAVIIGMRVAATSSERRRELERQLDRAHQREAYATTMHDVLSHKLTVIAAKAQLASRLLDADTDQAPTDTHHKDKARGEIDDIYELSHSALDDMRSALDELSPPSLMETVEEAQAVCTSAGMSFAAHVDDDIPPSTASLYAAIVKEATTNILQHSGAQSTSIIATVAKLIITDDGHGFDQEEPCHARRLHKAGDVSRQRGLDKKQHGLEGMKRRAHDIGASFSIRSAPGKGTTLTIEATQRKNRPEENKARSAQTSSAPQPTRMT